MGTTQRWSIVIVVSVGVLFADWLSARLDGPAAAPHWQLVAARDIAKDAVLVAEDVRLVLAPGDRDTFERVAEVVGARATVAIRRAQTLRPEWLTREAELPPPPQPPVVSGPVFPLIPGMACAAVALDRAGNVVCLRAEQPPGEAPHGLGPEATAALTQLLVARLVEAMAHAGVHGDDASLRAIAKEALDELAKRKGSAFDPGSPGFVASALDVLKEILLSKLKAKGEAAGDLWKIATDTMDEFGKSAGKALGEYLVGLLPRREPTCPETCGKPPPDKPPPDKPPPEKAPSPKPRSGEFEGATPVPPPPPLERRFVIYFEFNRWDLTDQAKAIVAQVVDLAKSGERRIAIVGKADRVGADGYNITLSQKRAEAVRGALIERGVRKERIDARSSGFHDLPVPTAPGMREPRNRVVEIAVD
ncbi:MAG TPA: OmpA family protein [Stellaceae bacterium]|nr:OmpA family protein [Stellaceae bacterium]